MSGRQSPSGDGRDRGAFTGRTAELRLVDRLLADVREGQRGVLLLVEGQAGVGLRRFLLEVEQVCADAVDCVRLSSADTVEALSAFWKTIGDRFGDSDLLDVPVPSSQARPLVAIVPAGRALEGPVHHRLESLLDGLDRHSLLLVVGVGLDHAAEPTSSPFRRWLVHPNVVHLRLETLAPEIVAGVVRAHRPGAAAEEVAAIVRVANGVPGVATELCRGLARAAGGGQEMSDVEALAVAPLLTCRIGASPAVRALEVVAAFEGPIHVRSVAAILGEPVDAVRALLDEAAASGLLVRDESSIVTGYTVGHQYLRILVRALAGERRWAELHRRLADALIADAGEADLTGPRATVVARHLAVAVDRPTDAARYFRRAAQAAEATADLQQARHWAGLGLAASTDRHEECKLLMIIGSVDERLGAVARGVSTLVRAHALAEQLHDDELLVEAAVRLLDASWAGGPVPVDSDAVAEQALTVAEAAPEALRARLHAHLAIHCSGRDEDGYRRHSAAAMSLAKSPSNPSNPSNPSDPSNPDGGAAVAAAIAAASCTTLPDTVESHLRLAQDGMALAGGDRLSALPATLFVNFALGRPAAVEVALDRFAAIESAHPHRWARVQLAVAALGLAVLDLDEARFVAAAREVVAEASSHVVRQVEFACALWEAFTGRRITVVRRAVDELADPPLLGVLSSAVQLLSPRLSDSGLGSGSALRESLDLALGRHDTLTTRLGDATWSTRAAIILRAAMVTDRPGLCRRLLDDLAPYRDQFVVIGHALPIGPVGWYVASALHWLGRTDEALEVSSAAVATSRRAGSQLWITHSGLQRAELLARRNPSAARAVRHATVSSPGLCDRADAVPRTVRTTLERAQPAAAAHPGWKTRISAPAEQQRTPTELEEARAAIGSLNARDLSLLLLLMDGASNAAIARAAGLSVPTVERRLSRLYRVLGASNRAHAAAVVTRLAPDLERLVARRSGRP